MKLSVRFDRPGLADGTFSVQAKGYVMAALRWANAEGPLEGWTVIGYVPLDAFGNGQFCLGGGRAVPPEATHVAAELVAPDFCRRELLLCGIPGECRTPPMEPGFTFAVMSDLHLTNGDGRIRRALRLAKACGCVLMAGDLTNDGLPGQFERLRMCIEEEMPGVPVLAVAGNHDYPQRPLPLIDSGVDSWPAMQRWLLERARALGVDCAEYDCGAWSARVGGVSIAGLNAVSHWRRFVFPDGEQTDWLEAFLKDKDRSIVLCHAPLLRHNPVRRVGEAPYLSRDGRIGQIVDGARNVIFISGHTHISINELPGCVDSDAQNGNIYINDSSVTATALRTPESPADWKWLDGAVLELAISARSAQLCARGVSHGERYPRGMYRWNPENGGNDR